MGRPFWTFLAWCGIHSLGLHRKVSSLWAAGCHFFLPAWQRITSDKFVLQVIRQGYTLPFVRPPPPLSLSPVETPLPRLLSKDRRCGKRLRPSSTRGPWRLSICPGRPGGILFPLLPGHQAHWWVPPHPQPTWSQLVYSSSQILHGNPDLNPSGSSQRLVDGVAGSQGCLFACTDSPQSLAVPSVCSQEPGRGAHCLSMESSPFWLSHCPQSFYQTPGSVSSSPAFAVMSDVSLHRHFSCSGVSKPDSTHPRHQSPLSLQAGFYHKPQEVGPCPVSGNAPLGSSDRHRQGIGVSIPGTDRNDYSMQLEHC